VRRFCFWAHLYPLWRMLLSEAVHRLILTRQIVRNEIGDRGCSGLLISFLLCSTRIFWTGSMTICIAISTCCWIAWSAWVIFSLQAAYTFTGISAVLLSLNMIPMTKLVFLLANGTLSFHKSGLCVIMLTLFNFYCCLFASACCIFRWIT
jgi:hypothetical protein